MSEGEESVQRILVRQSYPLHDGAKKGLADEVERYLAYGICEVNELDRFGQTALHIACYEGHIDIVRILIRKMANLNVQDKNGWSPLHSAASVGHLEICELLIIEGADPGLQVCSNSALYKFIFLLYIESFQVNSIALLDFPSMF